MSATTTKYILQRWSDEDLGWRDSDSGFWAGESLNALQESRKWIIDHAKSIDPKSLRIVKRTTTIQDKVIS